MKRIVFMNHRLKDPANRKAARPKPPVTLQGNKGRGRSVHAVEILDRDGVLLATIKWHPQGCRQVTTHEVLGWVEIEDRAIVETRKTL